MERKICPHCGAPLQAEASFCPRCTATLTERTAMTMPRTGRRRLHLLAVGFAAALTAGLAVWLWPAAETEPQRPNSAADPAAAADPAPDPYLAACQTYYTGADGREYHVFTAVTPSIEGRTDPVGYRSELIPAGGTVDFPATVMVEDAVDMALDILNGNAPEDPVKIIPTTILDRDTVESHLDENSPY